MKAWATALESDKFIQGKHLLKYNYNRNTKYCCLGVLCEISGNYKWEKEGSEGNESFYVVNEDGVIYSSGLPDHLISSLPDTLSQHALISANDTLDMNFKQIALMIRSHLPQIRKV